MLRNLPICKSSMKQHLVLVSLLVVGASTLTLSNSTRTAKLEILRSPTKVAIWKPDPYPILKTYGDEITTPPARNHTTPSPTISAEENKTESENEISADDTLHNYTENNSTLLEPPAKNTTCVRRDYKDDVAAVFKEEAGAIETAELVFNTTFQYPQGLISNVTELSGLLLLNETTVDCGVYFNVTS